jgi:hypothetical protein
MQLQSYNCELCNQGVEETLEHLFLQCPFAQDCWGMLNLQLSAGAVFENFRALKFQLNSKFFMEALILMCWVIWTARNELIFNANQFSLNDCRSFFFAETKLVGLRVKDGLSHEFDQWLDSLEMI